MRKVLFVLKIIKICQKKIISTTFREYNVQEGKELALICQDKNNRQNNKIAWRRKVGY